MKHVFVTFNSNIIIIMILWCLKNTCETLIYKILLFYRKEILLLTKQRAIDNKIVLKYYRQPWYVILNYTSAMSFFSHIYIISQ